MPAGAGAAAPHAQTQQPDAAAGVEFPRHLKCIRQLGRGAYGTVHLCDDTRHGTQVAVKHVRQAARHGKSILREIRLLARLFHDNLLHLLDFAAVPSPNFEDVFLVLPYMPSDLHKVIQSRQALTDKHVQVIMVQILRALTHLHAAGVAHRDLKPANILLSADCRLKICDFGLARGDMPDPEGDEQEQACGVLTEYVVTRWYRAPEVMLLPKHYTSAVDNWAVGCILCEILGRKALFPGKNHIDMVCRVAEVLGTPSDSELGWLPKDSDAYRFLRKVCPQSRGVPLAKFYPRATPVCLDLAAGLLRWDPSQRLTAAEAQEHEYIRSYLPKEAPAAPEPFDWSFDGFKPTASAVKERLYRECTRFHPEILERDGTAASPRIPLMPSGASITTTAAVPTSSPAPSAGYPSPPKSGTPLVPHRSPASARPPLQPGSSASSSSLLPSRSGSVTSSSASIAAHPVSGSSRTAPMPSHTASAASLGRCQPGHMEPRGMPQARQPSWQSHQRLLAPGARGRVPTPPARSATPPAPASLARAAAAAHHVAGHQVAVPVRAR